MAFDCLAFTLLLASLNFSSVPFPHVNETFLGARVFNATCDEVQLSEISASWVNVTSYVGSAAGGHVRCHANLTAYAYTGVVHAEVELGQSEVQLARRDRGGDSLFACDVVASTLKSCKVDATVARLYADPPSRLIDMLLGGMRDAANANAQSYVCGVVVPRVQRGMEYPHVPLPEARNSKAERRVYPVTDALLVQAATDVLSSVAKSVGVSCSTYLYQENIVLRFDLPPHVFHFEGSVVPAGSEASLLSWMQGLVDALVLGEVPHPFPVFGMPGTLTDVAVNVALPEESPWWARDVRVGVSLTLARCDANSCDVYLNPGIEIRDVWYMLANGFGDFVTQNVLPTVALALTDQMTTLMHALAVSQHRNLSDPNVTVRLSFGNAASVRQMPLVWPLVLILLLGSGGGAALVWRNVQQHAVQPVMDTCTNAPVTVRRLAIEDACVVGAATACLLLFAASNTMTGASVMLGTRLDTYAFSLWNTVTDLWRAGLIPLSVCVLIFSGVYPYVKLLSLVYFTVWAQQPCSRRLAVIDVLGKFSFIDTFALMVMVSGLEIRYVAEVVIHPGFYFFMYATVASIALGNYATNRYRRGTSSRVEHMSVASDGGYEPVATQDATETAPASADAAAPASDSPVAAAPHLGRWGDALRHVSVLPCALVLLCSAPAWWWTCLRYTVGGLARVVTPAERTLSLWQLSLLGKWGTFTADDAPVLGIFTVSLVTILVAPCLYALLHARNAFVASWCAADVFLVACIAGLLQLHQFVTFVLGDGMDDIYTAHATLRWPMLPLGVAALTVWYFVAREIAGVAWPSKRETNAASHGEQ